MTGFLISKGGDFKPPADGWIQLLSFGDFPNAEAGIVQHIDDEALDKIAADFAVQAKAENFPGLLVDFDHFSHSKEHPTESAAWIDSVERRGDELWAHWRLTEAGDKAVRGGNYRLTSTVLAGFVPYEGAPSDKHLRPTKLVRVALTNDPNIKGQPPVSNRTTNEHGDSDMADETKTKPAEGGANHKKLLCELLGLTEGASDEDIQKAIDLLKADDDGDEDTHPATLEADNREVDALTSQIVALNREVAESKAEKHFALVGEDKAVREALVTLMAENRTAATLVLEAITKGRDVAVTQAANRAGTPGRRFNPVVPAFDSSVQPTPGGDKSAGGDEGKTAKAIGVKAREIMASNRGMTWEQAWGQAERFVAPAVK